MTMHDQSLSATPLTTCRGALRSGVLLILLSACGGGSDTTMTGGGGGAGSGGGGGAGVPVVVNDTAANVSVPAGSDKIIGAHGLTLARLHANQIQLTNGAEAANGAVTIADGSSIFESASGYVNDVQTSSIGSIKRIATSQSYQYATLYSGAISDPGNSVFYGITQGVYGKEASPTSATVTQAYSGDARAIFQVSAASQPITLAGGESRVNINFGTDAVTVNMSNFNASSAPFDEIDVTGMSLSGTRYSGGTVTTRFNGAVVDITGANAASAATGVLLGDANAQGLPPETAGLVYARGDSGALSGAYLAK